VAGAAGLEPATSRRPAFRATQVRGPEGVAITPAGAKRVSAGAPRWGNLGALSQARRRTLGAAARFAARPDLLTGFQASA
jgi:hypothetical protein